MKIKKINMKKAAVSCASLQDMRLTVPNPWNIPNSQLYGFSKTERRTTHEK